MIETRLHSDTVDILIFAEGTYPFVRGGVSSWISDMVTNLPEYRFGIIFLGGYEDSYTEYAFELPKNVVHLQIVYLFDSEQKDIGPCKHLANGRALLEDIKELHQIFKDSHGNPKGLSQAVGDVGKMIDGEEGFDYCHFLRSEESWDFISDQYSKYCTDPSFIDYFWNIRNMHAPLWHLVDAVKKLPKAKVLHTISTGYAGFLASITHQHTGRPMFLSEHGIYTKERNIELLQTTMFVKIDKLIANTTTFTYQHRVWINFFDSLARLCYDQAQFITSIYQGAQAQQWAAGALAEKTSVIPNGVNIKKFAAVRRDEEAKVPKIVCFVGRVVRIKDIKTFIRAVAIMTEKDSEMSAWIRAVGNEDPDYMQECLDYITLLGLKDKICFIEESDMLSILSKIGVLVLSSISEGMPLVLLESLAAGIPVISTAVGSCPEIIEGRDPADKEAGKCGEVVSIMNASMLAEATVRLLNDRELWLNARRVGIKRIETYYDQTQMLAAYKAIYEKAIQTWPV